MKNKFLVLCLVICVVFSMQAIAAENVDADVLNQTDQLSVDDVDGDVLQVADEGQDVLTLDDEIPWSEETVVRVSGGNFSKLNNVIQNAANNSVIILEGDFTFDEDKDVSGAIHLTDKSIIIDGLGHTIDAKNETRIFWFENGNFTVIKNIVFKNAYNPSSDNSYTGGALSLVGNGRVLNCTFLNNSAGMAGALYWGYANQAQIFNCTFENNSALSAGGGAIRIRNNMTNVVIENSTFINNYAPTDGGAIHLANTQGSRSNSIINCTFINNTAASGGGAVLVQAPGCNVTNSTFINNSATLGGAMRWAGYSGTIRNTTFTTNHASSQGGAMHGTGDQPIVILSHFNNNTAPDGGAIWWGDTENGIITNSTFDYNIATGNAGAIHISGTLCNITYSNFTHNEANNGASIFLDVGAYISECLFEHERAYNDGGAIYLNSVDIDMYQIPQSVLAMLGLFNSTLYNCSAGNDGGAGYIRASGGVVRNVTFLNCSAGHDGGAGYVYGSNGSLINSTFIGNNATSGNGGAVYWYGINGAAYDVKVYNNTAVNGGGIYLSKPEDISIIAGYSNITFSDFSNNTAIDNGGSVYCGGMFSNILYSNFTHDKATNGSGIYLNVGAYIYQCSLFMENATYDGGGIYLRASNTGAIPQAVIDALGDRIGVVSTNITNCTAGHDGGAGYVVGNGGRVHDTNMINCSAGHDGGAGYVSGDYGRLYKSTMINNTAGNDGGALFWEGDGGHVEEITCDNNFADNNGGSIYISGSSVSFDKSNFTATNATNYGGSVYISGNYVNITNSRFERCAANTYHGGAVYITGMNITIAKSNFTMNRVDVTSARGGSIDVLGDNTTIDECIFDRCSAYEGGVVYVNGTGIRIVNSSCNRSLATNGGAFYVRGNNATIKNVTVSNNNATAYGGALYVSGNFANITNSSFMRCIAYDYHGGAVYIIGLNTTISKSFFQMNNATNATNMGRGGSIDVQGNGTDISNCTFMQCSSYEGGVLYVNGTGITIYNCTSMMSSAVNGGAVYIMGGNVTVDKFTISLSNATDYGGAMYVAGDFANITNANITKCVADNFHGGAMYVKGLNTTISKSFFQMNNATNATNMGRGGSIDVQGNGTNISQCIFMQCSAYEGGVIYVNGTGITIYNCTSMMSSAVDGGAVYIRGNNVTVDKFTFSLSNATDYGGAMYVAGDFANITNSNITECVADNFHGGAMYVRGLNTTISKSFFQMNNATNMANSGRGGSIDVQGNGTNISECIFMQCSAYEGGVLYVNGTGITIYNCTSMMSSAFHGGSVYIMGNNVTVNKFSISMSDATISGGAIYVAGDCNNITGSKFNINVAQTSNGGSVYILGANTTVSHSTFNTTVAANANGGSIYVEGDNAAMINLTCENAVATDGAAIYAAGNFCELYNSTFNNNNALDDSAVYWYGDNGTIYNITCFNNTGVSAMTHHSKGGSLSIIGNGTSVDKSTFTQSFAANQAGALYITGNDVNVTNSVFYNSTIRDNENGGTMYILGNRTNVVNCSIEMSRATNGGAIYVLGNNVTVACTNITNTNASTSGGAIYILGEYANITGCNVNLTNAFGHTDDGGGAIFIKGNYTSVSKSNFTQTRANYNNRAIGGALYITGDGVNVTDSNFNDTGANRYGGAIYIAGVNTTIKGSNFTNCTVNNGDGGAIYGIGHNTNISNSRFENNSASSQGGAVSVNGRNLTVLYSVFINNSAPGGGGAIHSIGANSNIYRSNFTNNSAFVEGSNTVYGGAIYWNGAGSGDTISYCNFENNTATGSGGAVYWGNAGSNGLILYSNFTNNSAYSYGYVCGGGAIYVHNHANGTVRGCNFINNTADKTGFDSAGESSGGAGGALYWDGPNAIMEDSYFYGNNATITHNSYGGGAVMITTKGANASINNCTFEANNGIYGGSLFVDGNNLTINNSSFISNRAGFTGFGAAGAIMFKNVINSNISNSTFENNSALNNGGAIFYQSTNNNLNYNVTVVYNTTFVGNEAGGEGGAIVLEFKNAYLLNNSFINNSALRHGGGAIYVAAMNVTVNGTYFNNNSAVGRVGDGQGGAIRWISQDGTLYNATFVNHTNIKNNGGAIYWIGSSANMSYLNISNSYCGAIGGSIYLSGTTSSLSYVNITNSTSEGSGGSIYWAGSYGNLTNISIIGSASKSNNGNEGGGALFVNNNYVNATNVTISDSTAREGGSIRWSGQYGCLYNVTIDNSSANNGGAIYWASSYGYIFNLTITDTHSTGNNGGAITWTGSDGKIINSTINNTYSGDRGGAIYWTGNNGILINASFYNTTANKGNNRQGGAINWYGSNGVLTNISIVKSFSSNLGGAIYLAKNANLTNVNITNSSSTNGGGGIFISTENSGAAAYSNLTNVNIVNSSSNNGGGIYVAIPNINMNNITIFNATASVNGGGIYITSAYNILNNASISNATATVNGGGIYVATSNNALNKLKITNSTAVLGGAIYIGVDSGSIQNINITNSSITNNNASTSGGAIYYRQVSSTNVFNTNITNNNATQGSAIYAKSSTYNLENVTLLDNQAHSNKFINKVIGTYANGTHYLSGVFVGYDNLLNSIWSESNSHPSFTNVTYWDADGVTTTDTVPDLSDRETGQNITIEKYDSRLRAPSISTATVVTDGDGKFTYNFEGDGVPIASFKIYHLEDTYYTYLADSISINTTIVNITVDDITHYQYPTIKVNLTDGNGNKLSGTVTVTINATETVTVTVTVTNGEGSQTITTLLDPGVYNATAFIGSNSTHLGSTNWDEFNVLPLVDLNITKWVNTTTAYIGDSLKYEINVTNHGPDTALDVKVNETLSPDLELTNEVAGYDRETGIWTIGELEKDATATLILIVKVINNGTIANSVNVTSWGNDTNPSNDNASAENVTALPVNNFTITKTNNLTGNICSAGELVNFTITVTNNGPSNATNVNITDELNSVFEFVSASEGGIEENGVVRWVIGNMNNGTTLEFWVVAKVKTNGTYTNTAKINSTENNTGSSNFTQITATPVNNLTLVKANNWTDNVGYVNDLVNFTITVTNNGPSNASNVNIVDELNANFEFIDASSGGSYDEDTHKVTWTIDYLVNGTSSEVWVVVKVKSNGTFENVASVTSTENSTQKANGTKITAKPVNNFIVIKYANVTGNIYVYDLVNFTINVTNLGPSNATNVNITDVLPEGMKVLYHGGNVTGDKTTVDGKDIVTWTIGNLNKDEMVSLWVVVNVTTNGTFRNVASVNSTENTTDTPNGTDITVRPVNNFTVIKYANITGDIWVNDLVNFTINVTNNGPSNATNVNITDVLGPAFEFNATDGSYNPETRTVSWNIPALNNGTTASRWVVVRVITNGTFRNVASVNSTENTTDTPNGTEITVKPVTNLTVVKTTNWTDNIGYAGSLVNFTITVTNNGPSNATNVNLTDVLDAGFVINSTNGHADGNKVIWNIGNLNNGTSFEAWVVVKVLNNGTFRNVASVNSTENTTDTTNGTDITVRPVNNFTVIKYANITGDIWVNDLVNFTINVTNNGPSNATNVNITDVLGPEFEFNATDGSYDRETRTVFWNISTLNNGTTASRWVVVRVITNGTFRNVASVNSTENITDTTNGTEITVKPVNNLTLIKYANVTGHVHVGDLVNFTINVTNHGPSNATNINITDMLPAGLELVAHGGNVTGENTTVDDRYLITWRFETLNKDDMVSIWVVVRVTTNGTFTNAAKVNSTENETGTSNETTIASDAVTNLTLIKYVNVTGSVMVNSLVNFTINITNLGPSVATNVNITDVLPEGMKILYYGGDAEGERSTNDDGRDVVIWRFATLNKDVVRSVWVVVNITSNGTFRNVASVSSTENTTGTENGTDIVVNPVNNFTVIKYANVTEGVKVNDLVNFTINITNNGPSNATNVNLTDVLSPEFKFEYASSGSSYDEDTRTVTWTISSLNNGTNTSVWVVVKVLTNGTFRNNVKVNSSENNTGSENGTDITVNPFVNLTVVKTTNWTNNVGYAGSLVNFTITVTNNGPSNATNVNLTDVLDVGFVINDTNGHADGNKVIWQIGNLNNGTSFEAWVVVKVMANGTIRNVASVNSTENTTETTNGTEITVNPVNNFTVIKYANITGDIWVNDLVNFTINVTNNGPSNATNVNITDVLGPEFEFNATDGSYDRDTRIVSWNIPALNNGTTASRWVVVRVITNGTFRNVVSVNSTENITDTTNGTEITVKPVNNLTLIKYANVTGNVKVNDLVNFTINVTNHGPSNATNINITDMLPAGLVFVSAGGNVTGENSTVDGRDIVIWKISTLNKDDMVSLWVVVRVTTNGTFTNTAKVNSTENETGTSNETTITSDSVTNLTLIKYANVTGSVMVNSLVNFTINITNLGPSVATNVNITDVLPEGMKVLYYGGDAEGEKSTNGEGRDVVIWRFATLNNDDMRSVWVVVNVTGNGTFRNVASVSSTENTTGTENGTDLEVKPVNNFTVIKYANVTEGVKVNDLVNFTINITNNGPSNATNVNLTDVLGPEFEFNATDGSYNRETRTVTWNIGSLNNGTTASRWVVVRVLTNGTFRNTASVNSTENDIGSENGTAITVNPFVNLTVVKTTNWTNNIGYAGSLVNFTITVTNNGPSNATNVNITDVLDDGFEFNATNGRYVDGHKVIWNIGNLNNGTSYEVWVVVKVLNNGTFRNVASVNSTENSTGTENGTEITVEPVNNLTLIKYANVTGNVKVGDLVNFTINMTNHGPSVATNINITDELPVGMVFVSAGGNVTGENSTVDGRDIVVWRFNSLNSNDMVSVWVVVRVTTNGTFTNVASVNSTENTTGTENGTTITSDSVTNLTLIKYANVTGNVKVYDLVNFTINVTNLGPSNATNVNITDELPDGLVFVCAGGNVTGNKYTIDGKEVVIWTIGNLNKDEMVSLWVVVNVTRDGTFRNTATVNSTENNTGTTNGTDITSDPVTNLTVIKYANVTGNAKVNDLVNFTINVTNNGPSTATNVNISDVLDSSFELIAHEGSYNETTRTITWDIGTLQNNGKASVWVVVRVLTNGTFRNVASVNSTENSTGTENGTEITVEPVTNLTLIKYANVTGNVKVGDLVNFTINMTNYGPSIATNVNITDELPDGLVFVSAGGNVTGNKYTIDGKEVVIWTIGNLNKDEMVSVWVVVRVTTNGTFTNVASVNSTENTTGTENGTTITSDSVTNLTLIKYANVTGNVKVYDLVNFTINVTNLGPSNATNVNITDELPDGLVFVSAGGNVTGTKYVINNKEVVIWTIGNLNKDEMVSLWVVVNVTREGRFTNLASVNSTENNTGNTNGTEITSDPVTNLTVIKYANVTGNVKVNDLVNFTINVTNNGPSTATNVNVTDVLDSSFELVAHEGSYDATTRTITWDIGTLQNNGKASVWVVVRVKNNGTFTNTATVNSTENETGTTNGTDITVEPVTNLTLIKYANVTGNVKVGDLVNFTINMTNYGPSVATHVNITDMLPAGLELVRYGGNATGINFTNGEGRDVVLWTVDTLNSNDMVSVWVIVRVTTNGTFTNIATVNSTENTTGTENGTTITSDSVTNLTLIKYANVTGNVNVYDLVNFTINVTNYGPSNATNVNITDELPDGLVFVSAGGNVTGTKYVINNKEVIIWNVGNLNKDEMVSLWVVVNVTKDGTFRNTATVNSTENTTGTTNGTDITSTPVTNLTVIKYANVTENVRVNDLVNFTINVTNNGPSTATNVNITDVLDSSFELVAHEGSYDEATRTITWNVGTLPNNGEASVWVVVRVKNNGTFTNTATANSTENTSGTTNSTEIKVNPVNNLTLIKYANVTTDINVGDLVNFTINVTNHGPSKATNVNITDSLPTGLAYVTSGSNVTGVNGDIAVGDGKEIVTWNFGSLDDGESVSVWVVVRITVEGVFINNATVNSTENSSGTTNGTQIPSELNVDLEITKTVNTETARYGDVIIYTIKVKNNGPGNATGVNVTEIMSSHVKLIEANPSKGQYDSHRNIWYIGNLDNDDDAQLTLKVQVTYIGIIENSVIISGNENDTNRSNNNYTSKNVTATPADSAVWAPDVTEYYGTPINVPVSSSNALGVTYIIRNSTGQIIAQGSLAVGQGIANLNLDADTYIVYLTTLTDANHYPASYQSKITILKVDSSIKVNTTDITYGDDENITITLPGDVTGTVNITVGDRTYENIPIINGTVNITVPDLAGGNYTVNVTYGGDKNHNGNSTTATFEVARAVPVIKIFVEDIWYGEVEVLNVTVNAPGSVNVTVNGITVTIDLENGVVTTSVLAASGAPNYDGKATWNIIGLNAGTYPAFAIYNGNENYTSVNTTDEFIVRALPTTVTVKADDINVGEDAIISVEVGPANATGNVTITIEGKNYAQTLENGKATFTIPGLKAGTKDVSVSYFGDGNYLPSENATAFDVNKVKPAIDVTSHDIEEGDDETITIHLPDDATGTVTIIVDGKKYTAPVINGKATFTIPGLKPGNYEIKVHYSGDDKYLLVDTTDSFKVSQKDRPHNKTHSDGGIDLTVHQTGNPILYILLILIAFVVIPIRKFKK